MYKEEFKVEKDMMIEELGRLQRELKDLNIPVMIAFEGYGASGKGYQIGKLLEALDPRGFVVYPVKKETKDEEMHPFLWRFWTKMPGKGRIAIYDSSWYRRVLIDYFDGKVDDNQVKEAFHSIRVFEKELTDDGMVIIKIFLDITKKEQKKRFGKLLKSKNTAWRVTKDDLKRNQHFKEYKVMNEVMLEKTNTANAPWHIVSASDKKTATYEIYKTIIAVLEKAVADKKTEKTAEKIQPEETLFTDTVLDKVDLEKSYTKEEYKKKLKPLEKKIKQLHGELYRRRIPVVIGFEGWDAGGKGGAIKRLTKKMDPRGYVVHPTAAPNDVEKEYHYLWRFWNAVPKYGHVTVFDRTWYGRVMVERIEGFAKEEEWKRAYDEILEMEKDWTNEGYIVLKFWMQIDKEEQKKRFEARLNDPDKQWKITDEDWRNREKWDKYEDAVNEMIIKTSVPQAPWIIVEGNDKYYARIKVLETVVDAIERRLQKEK